MMSADVRTWVTFLLILSCTQYTNTSATFADFEFLLQSDPFQYWPFNYTFASFGDLMLSKGDRDKAMVNDGLWTRLSLKRVFSKILESKPITAVAIGSSVVNGAELGPQNLYRTFHYGFAVWWNATIGPTTGSYLNMYRVGLGSSVTSYISHCWSEYLPTTNIDLLIWEFRINDQPIELYKEGLERFTRAVIALPSHPSLIYATFFMKELYFEGTDDTKLALCTEYEQNEISTKNFSQEYKVTLFSLEKLFCSMQEPHLQIEDIITGTHPSFRAHAQMSYLIISYIQSIFLLFSKDLEYGGFRLSAMESDPYYVLGDILQRKTEIDVHSSICWTALTLDYRAGVRHSLFDLPVMRLDGFVKVFKFGRRLNEERYDTVGGYSSVRLGSRLILKLEIGASRFGPSTSVTITIKNKYFGGKVRISLYDEDSLRNIATKMADSSERVETGLTVVELAQVVHGRYFLILDCIDKGAVLSAVCSSN